MLLIKIVLCSKFLHTEFRNHEFFHMGSPGWRSQSRPRRRSRPPSTPCSRAAPSGTRSTSPWSASRTFIPHKSFFKSICRSQVPQTSINTSFTITNVKNKLTDLCGNWLSQNDFKNSLCEIRPRLCQSMPSSRCCMQWSSTFQSLGGRDLISKKAFSKGFLSKEIFSTNSLLY